MCSTFQRAIQVIKTHLLTSTWAPLSLGSASRHWHSLACDLEHPLPLLTRVQASCVLQTKGDQSHMLWRLVGWAAEDARGGEHFRVVRGTEVLGKRKDIITEYHTNISDCPSGSKCPFSSLRIPIHGSGGTHRIKVIFTTSQLRNIGQILNNILKHINNINNILKHNIKNLYYS